MPEDAKPPSAPLALVVRTAGTNCDAEMVRAFELAGARVELVHLDRLITEPERLESAGLLGLPGGFSYGDDVASGRLFAARLRERLWGPLRKAAERGCLMIGVCNGFQVLVQVGLLPGPDAGGGWPESGAPTPTVGLAANSSGRFIDRWVGVELDRSSPCVWTAGLAGRFDGERRVLPIAHGEGRVVAEDAVLDELESSGRVPLRYSEDVNGSARRIAGVCDAAGRIFGLMPHPERYLDRTSHPFWTRLGAERARTLGLAMFVNAVRAAGRPEAAAARAGFGGV